MVFTAHIFSFGQDFKRFQEISPFVADGRQKLHAQSASVKTTYPETFGFDLRSEGATSRPQSPYHVGREVTYIRLIEGPIL